MSHEHYGGEAEKGWRCLEDVKDGLSHAYGEDPPTVQWVLWKVGSALFHALVEVADAARNSNNS